MRKDGSYWWVRYADHTWIPMCFYQDRWWMAGWEGAIEEKDLEEIGEEVTRSES
jgi:hypothetical protein